MGRQTETKRRKEMEKDMRWEERQINRQMKTEKRQLYTQTDGTQTEMEYD
jgi:hypothetical protein